MTYLTIILVDKIVCDVLTCGLPWPLLWNT